MQGELSLKSGRTLTIYFDLWCVIATGLLISLLYTSFKSQLGNSICIFMVTFLWMKGSLFQARKINLFYQISWYLQMLVLILCVLLLLFLTANHFVF